MAQNLLWFYKHLTIELLEDLLKFMDGDYYIGDNKRELKKEGKTAIEESLAFLKSLQKDLLPMYWNKYITKAAVK